MKIIKKSVQVNFFNDILNGEKNYEFRMNNFEINPGDKILLEEEAFDLENKKEKTGRFIEKEVFHIWKFNLDKLFYNLDDMLKNGLQIISFLPFSKELFFWSIKKEKIKSLKISPHIHEREIWNVRLGINIGFEEDGKGDDFLRPVLVYKVFGNGTFWGIPLTTTNKNLKMYFYLGNIDGKNSTAILSQIRLLDNKRLSYKIGVLSKEKFQELNKKFKELLP